MGIEIAGQLDGVIETLDSSEDRAANVIAVLFECGQTEMAPEAHSDELDPILS
jgi:hypothetical protein